MLITYYYQRTYREDIDGPYPEECREDLSAKMRHQQSTVAISPPGIDARWREIARVRCEASDAVIPRVGESVYLMSGASMLEEWGGRDLVVAWVRHGLVDVRKMSGHHVHSTVDVYLESVHDYNEREAERMRAKYKAMIGA